MINRETYCNDCDRSIYGKYRDCDVNIENDGKYVMADDLQQAVENTVQMCIDAVEVKP